MIEHLNYRRGLLLDQLQAPGLQRIFAHDYSELGIPTLAARSHRLSNIRAERALLLAQPGDVVILSEAVAPEYLRYLDELGVGPGQNYVVAVHQMASECTVGGVIELALNDAVIARIDALIQPGLRQAANVFFGGALAHEFVRTYSKGLGRAVLLEAGQPEATVIANRKDEMRNAAVALGIAVAAGEIVTATDICDLSQRLESAVARHMSATGGVMIRAAWSGGGLDNRIIDRDTDIDQLQGWLRERAHIQTYLVESLIEVESSPNVQMWITQDGTCEVMEITNQRLDHTSTHVGNESPYAFDEALIVDAAKIGCFLSDRGYRGPLGLDFIKTPAGDYRFVEVNGRINGATYCIALAGRINQLRKKAGMQGIDAWIGTKKLACRYKDYATLHAAAGDLLYLHGRDEGAVPYNSGQLLEGGISFTILADSIERAKHIEQTLAARLAG